VTGVDRRDGALVVSLGLPGSFAAAELGAAVKPPLAPDQLDSWLAIKSDGDVVAYFGKMDMGQGVDVAIAQIRRPIDDARAPLRQRLSLAAGAVVDRQVTALLQQARGEHRSHPSGADPAECQGLRFRGGHRSFAPMVGSRGSSPAPAAVDPRTISSGLKITRRRLGSPVSTCSSSSLAAADPKS